MQDESQDGVWPAEERPDGEPAGARPNDEASEESPARQDERPDRRPVHGLGCLGCLTLVLAALAAIALVSIGRTWAVAAGVLLFAVAAGVGLWLYNVSTLGKK